MFDFYDETARAHGFDVTPGHHGYMMRVHVAETDDKAHEEGKALFGGRIAQVSSMTDMKIHPDVGAWMAPPGYVSKEAALTRKKFMGGTPYAFFTQGYEKALETTQIVVGSPETVVKKLNELRKRFRLGHLGISHFPMEDESQTQRNMELLGERVFPRLREMADAD
jgi:alkanesulfonate monooxygenase SsuD/methylene tetrahydromethanopterin reductase-like flavin-dependent oxidoreductase (luciferase family)